MTKNLFFVLIILLTACSQSESTLLDDLNARQHLTDNEILAFSSLTKFVEKKINCPGQNNKDACWRQFLLSEHIDFANGRFIIPWSTGEQHEYIERYKLGSVIDDIFYESISIDPYTNDTSKYFRLNFTGSLGKLFNGAGDESLDWREIWQSIEKHKRIHPNLFQSLLTFETNPLITDPKMRLLIPLEFLRLKN